MHVETVQKVSVHGGHSGQFCLHATDSLEAVVQTYIDKGFNWVGITEHMPPPTAELRYADQREEGQTPAFLLEQFGEYIHECRRLQQKYGSRITLYAAMETETCSGYETFVPYLIDRFNPDYVVGSVHHVNDINFDYSEPLYRRAADAAGGVEQLYLAYFDLQRDMIELLKPAVVGHFDLIRLFDPDYRKRLEQPAIAAKIRRNLELIKAHGLILDFNLRALYKGASEPYISESILNLVKEYEISIVPGDDSHGVSTVGNHFEQGVAILRQHGFSTDWPRPA